MTSVNKIILIGRLGQDPELRQTNSQMPVCNMSVATTETNKDKQETTEWHRIVVFGKTAENCKKYLSKGSMVYIEGRLQTRSWEKDGHKHYATETIANTVQFLSSKGERPVEAPKSAASIMAEYSAPNLDDLPF